MGDPRLVNGKLEPRSKNDSFIVRVHLFGEDADRFEQFCIDNEFETASHALRALVLGGMADWAKWGVNLADRKRVMYEFKQELGSRFGQAMNKLLDEIRAEYAALEPPPHAHQT